MNQQQEVPPFQGNIGFNAQHSPMGAFLSFTCGYFGTRGGLGLQIGKPADHDLYIGVKDGDRFSDAPLKCLPFFHGATGDATAAFVPDQAGPAEQSRRSRIDVYAAGEMRRHYGWATDRWAADDLAFTIYTPFGPLPDPDRSSAGSLRAALVPAVTATLTLDNRRATRPRTAFFAMNFNAPGARPLTGDAGGGGHIGFAWRDTHAVAASASAAPQPFVFCRFDPEDGLKQKVPHMLGTTPGIGIEVPPGQQGTLTLALAAYLPGIVTTRLHGRYLYTRHYGSLEEVLSFALGSGRIAEVFDRSRALDLELLNSGLSPNQQFLIAHSTRSYYGSTQLLDVAGQPFWMVNEGEYCMMNTLDLAVDQVFWELKHNPWTVRNVLDNFVRYYSYHDQVKAGGALAPGGISFCHDMGVNNNFSPFGHSSYELPDLPGCFSYMTQEQLCNWILMAACYVAKTGDFEWARQQAHVFIACVESMESRDERPDPTGLMSRDSARCESGQEITTYDSLDESLGQARANLYLAVKRWAAYVGLDYILRMIWEPGVGYVADIAAVVVAQRIGEEPMPEGFIPAVLEQGNPGSGSRILAAPEALIYQLYWQSCTHYRPLSPEHDRDAGGLAPATESMYGALKKHIRTLLLDPARRNLFPDGGIKLSSTSDNSWVSKIALFQHVAREVFRLDEDPKIRELFEKADAAHVRWQTDGSGYWACSDQIVSGIARGSRYYPRIITTALWMDR